MKRLIIIGMAMALLAVCGCGSQDDDQSADESSQSAVASKDVRFGETRMGEARFN